MVTIIRPAGNVIDLTIANGASVSDVAQLGGRQLVGLITPAAWTTAVLTFQACAAGTNYRDVYDDAVERSIASATIGASRFLALDSIDWFGMGLLRLRSGTSASPTNQGAERVFQLVLADPGYVR